MSRANNGDRVTVHYIGTLDNGRIFDQRDAESPLTFTAGAGELFPSLEQEILGMKVGDVRNIHLASEEAFGKRLEENILKVARDLFPAEKELKIGQKLQIELADGTQKTMRIREIGEQQVLLDGNHDLAGCNLTFALQLVAIDTN
ncbi:MAG: peptidylprolyl isomerase [Desulfuromonas sp.]|nr:MAG: peptidylprolyl isomerase [Desulfuromonas sp.]